jgi:penicillin-binding protein 1C
VNRFFAFVVLVVLTAQVDAAVPTPAQVKASWQPSDAQLLDRHGLPLESVRIDMAARRQPWVALSDISPGLGRAVMQAEDQRFMEHGGIDLKAVGQAAWDNLFRVRSQARLRGASTITPRWHRGRRAAAGRRSGTRRWRRANWRPAGASSRYWKPI